MSQIRNRGVYQLPNDQRKVFAFAVGKDEFYLYDLEFGTRLPPRYAINSNGVLTNWFDDFSVWSVEDLIDTGEDC